MLRKDILKQHETFFCLLKNKVFSAHQLSVEMTYHNNLNSLVTKILRLFFLLLLFLLLYRLIRNLIWLTFY